MSTMITVSSLCRSMISTWAVLISIGFIANCIYVLLQKRKANAVSSFIGFILTYCIFQISAEIMDYMRSGIHYTQIGILEELSVSIYFVVLVVLSIFCIYGLANSYRYGKSHITPQSIKEAADDLPTGFVYYRDNGMPYLINNLMNKLSFELFGTALLDGNAFCDMLDGRETMTTQDGNIYRFTRRSISLDGEVLNEIVAEDVTELYHKIEKLRIDNALLKENNLRMKEYNLQIEENIKREETLKAKLRIHDEMNRLLLAIDRTIKNASESEKKKFTDDLRSNAFFLVKSAEEGQDDPLTDLEELSKHIGLRLHMERKPESCTDRELTLFVLAAEECMVNAVKHAEAVNFYIEIIEDPESLTAKFTNDGNIPEGPVKPSGGLITLRHRIEACGGTMKVYSLPKFAVKIVIPKGEN